MKFKSVAEMLVKTARDEEHVIERMADKISVAESLRDQLAVAVSALEDIDDTCPRDYEGNVARRALTKIREASDGKGE